MIKRLLGSALLLCVLAATLHGQGREALLEQINTSPGWTSAGSPAHYDAAAIDSFDPDLAPALRRYGVEGISVQTWQAPEGPVRATLFEMLDAHAAYGFFTLRRRTATSPDTEFPAGTEAFRSGNTVTFWQAHYVVEINGDIDAATRLTQTVSENIFGRSQKPSVANHLPPANLVYGSETYVLAADDLEGRFGVEPSSMGFDDSAEGASALYQVNGTPVRLLLLLYPTPQMAVKYEEQFMQNPSAVFQKRSGPLVALVAGGTDETAARTVLDQVNHEYKVTWNEPPPDLNFGTVLITIFSFTGLALLVCLIAGFGYGALRVWVKAKYPDLVFDRPQDVEIIQLKLDQGLMRKSLGK